MKRFLWLFIPWLFFACSKGEDSKEDASESSSVELNSAATLSSPVVKAEADSINSVPAAEESVPRKRITQGQMSIESPDLQQARRLVDSLCHIHQGWFASESQVEENQRFTLRLELRIPAASFQTFVNALESGSPGKVVSKSTNSEDITAQYFDNESRLTSERAYLDRYRAMLQKAKTIKEMLEIEERIRLLTEEIESRMSQRKLWDHQVSYSQLSLEIYQLKPFVYDGNVPLSFGERAKESFFRGGSSMLSFFLGLISLWPFMLLSGIGYFWWRKRKSSKA